MIKKSVFEDEIISAMEKELTANEKSAAIGNLSQAAEYLHSALEVFEDAGMTAQADAVLHILLKIASKNHDPHTAGLTSEKMVANWKDHGSWFNADDNAAFDELLASDELNIDDLLDDDVLSVDGGINDLLEADMDPENQDKDWEDEI